LAGGCLLAISGVLLQRATGNDMASPEILGISSAAALGVLCALLVVPNLDVNAGMYGAIIGTFAAASVIMAMCLLGVEPLRLLLGGMALTIICSGLIAFFLASGDPRMSAIISWLSGSTYNATVESATVGFAATLAVAVLAAGLIRILTVLPLGDAVAAGIGVSIVQSRTLVFLVAAIGTACGTVLIGPLTFVGLIAPHLARQLGCRGPRQELLVAAALGGTTLMLADWIGRNLIYPWQLPAGIVAAIISGPFVVLLLRRAGQ
jgi:ABC-type Fe3+-siderophore transport system permease subunit